MDPQQRLPLGEWPGKHAGIPPGARCAPLGNRSVCRVPLSRYGAMASARLSQVDGWSNSSGAMSIAITASRISLTCAARRWR